MSFIPKHIEDGKKLNMRIGLQGEAFITIDVINEENGASEKVEFLVDTGFNGFLQLQQQLVSKLGIEISNKTKSRGFDGVEKEIGVVKTKIRILNEETWNFPVQVIEKGPFLIGTKLLKDLKKMIIIDYRNARFTITSDKRVQKKVHKAVDKYAK